MKAILVVDERHQLSEDSFAQLRLWRVPEPVRRSRHLYRYALAHVVAGVCVLRYDNEPGKGDHKHIGNREMAYEFTGPDDLLVDFWADVDSWRPR